MKKRCPKCNKKLPTDKFHRNSHATDGLSYHCKECRKSFYTPKETVILPQGKKKCPGCKRSKVAETEFYRTKNSTDGYYSQCKSCHGLRVKNWAERNYGAYREYQAKWAKENKEQLKIARRKHDLKKKYGLTEQEFDILVKNANGKCPLCDRTDGKLVVDHCHDTGKIRGVICPNCNVGLGLFSHSPEALRKAAAYLEC